MNRHLALDLAWILILIISIGLLLEYLYIEPWRFKTTEASKSIQHVTPSSTWYYDNRWNDLIGVNDRPVTMDLLTAEFKFEPESFQNFMDISLGLLECQFGIGLPKNAKWGRSDNLFVHGFLELKTITTNYTLVSKTNIDGVSDMYIKVFSILFYPKWTAQYTEYGGRYGLLMEKMNRSAERKFGDWVEMGVYYIYEQRDGKDILVDKTMYASLYPIGKVTEWMYASKLAIFSSKMGHGSSDRVTLLTGNDMRPQIEEVSTWTFPARESLYDKYAVEMC